MNRITIGVATHKKYRMPDDEVYLPIQSGAALSDLNLSYQRDNVGENISIKNPNYSELTALYWLWKNDHSEYKGLVHYRRHFSSKHNYLEFRTGNFSDLLDVSTLEHLLTKVDIILPKKRKYYIETIKSHYEHTHYGIDLEVTENVIKSIYPDYLNSYNKVLNRKSAHMFNMFVMSENKFDEYCEWLFKILFEIEKKLDISQYSDFHARVFGRISEILLDVWLDKKKYNYVEIPVMFMENQSWSKKIVKFLKAKAYRVRY
ncbi:DUF4422 domain-containing protein [Enterococcus canintestini]|uniref:DUF4422 domain-containing protein n=1 Tax=Enterococcus canintestini TaxID=317010 RepID=UPI00289266CE|nr:DUF4422 domain-containing protein [Enterococcus canintestini]MDT2740335.1 DUF4422 domain-containing protein [Enterococcus canintestini]